MNFKEGPFVLDEMTVQGPLRSLSVGGLNFKLKF
jgi:hypothetical protein